MPSKRPRCRADFMLAEERRRKARCEGNGGRRGGRKRKARGDAGGDSFNVAVLLATRHRSGKEIAELPKQYASVGSLYKSLQSILVIEVAHVALDAIQRRSSRHGAPLKCVSLDDVSKNRRGGKMGGERIVRKKVKLLDFPGSIIKYQFLQPGTLYVLKKRENRSKARDKGRIMALLAKWDEGSGCMEFDCWGIHSEHYETVQPVLGMTNYRRMYMCALRRPNLHPPELARSLIGMPRPKHLFFSGTEDEDEAEATFEQPATTTTTTTTTTTKSFSNTSPPVSLTTPTVLSCTQDVADVNIANEKTMEDSASLAYADSLSPHCRRRATAQEILAEEARRFVSRKCLGSTALEKSLLCRHNGDDNGTTDNSAGLGMCHDSHSVRMEAGRGEQEKLVQKENDSNATKTAREPEESDDKKESEENARKEVDVKPIESSSKRSDVETNAVGDSRESFNATLNGSQQEVVRKFLRRGPEILAIQGPPGTGKTRTIVHLLRAAIDSGRFSRFVVCAPSNKAVHVLLRGFLASYKRGKEGQDDDDDTKIGMHRGGFEGRCVLVGVKEEVPDDLCPVFVHNFGNHLLARASECVSILRSALEERGGSANISKSITRALGALKELDRIARRRAPNVYGRIEMSTSVNDAMGELRKLTSPTASNGGLSLFWGVSKALETCKRVESCIASGSNMSLLEDEWINIAEIAFSTICCVGRRSMRRRRPSDVLIVDEAAQAVELETLVAFQARPRKKILLVGDPFQLSASARSPIARRAGFERSLLQRLMDVRRDANDDHDCSMLRVQYRMHPEISMFPNKHFYASKIRDAEIVTTRTCSTSPWAMVTAPISLKPSFTHEMDRDRDDIAHHYVVVDVSRGREIQDRSGSYSNEVEASLVPNVVRWALSSDEGRPGATTSFSIITFYSAQVRAIKRALSKQMAKTDFDRQTSIRVSTVDSFQGDESDIVILSCVRANERRVVGFLSEFRRLNVALTRAKRGLVVLCHARTLSSSSSKDLRALVADAHSRGVLYSCT
eukprot:g3049.t1